MKKTKILGLIMEINPMHNGHKYFIDQAIKEINPNYTVCVISPSFSMRADPIILKKYDRVKMLLESKVDVVVEMPSLYEINSSDYFCKVATDILKKFNITDLAFGVETNNLDSFKELINILDDPTFNMMIKDNLSKGVSYSNSINKALIMVNKPHLAYINSSPNNILALGYLKNIINSNINPYLIQRINNNYYDETLNNTMIQSATSLRNSLSNGNSISNYIPEFSFDYSYYDINEINKKLLLLLKYNLDLKTNKELRLIHDCNEGIESRLKSFSNSNSIDEFISSVITKRYSINKIKRLIFNIVSNNTNTISSDCNLSYLRVLGFNNKGKKLISKLDKDTKDMIISNLKVLNDKKYKEDKCLNFEYNVIKLYDILVGDNTISDEYLFPIRIED